MKRTISLLAVLALLSAACDRVAPALPRADLCGAVDVGGSTGTWSGEHARVTVRSVERGSKVEDFMGEPKEWRGYVADLEVCALSAALTLNQSFLFCESQAFDWGTGSGAEMAYSKTWPQDIQFREPVLDQWGDIPAGECRSGWLTFVETWSGGEGEAPKPVAVVYQETDADGIETAAAWPIAVAAPVAE